MKKSEVDIVRECKDLLDLLRCANQLEYRIIHIPDPRGGIRAQARAQSMRGHADCEIYLRGGRVVHIEFKRPNGGRQSEPQKIWQKDLENIGHKYYLVNSIATLRHILCRHRVKMYKWQHGDLVPSDSVKKAKSGMKRPPAEE